MAPRIGYLLPTRERVMEGRPETGPLLVLAERAEALGYDSIWVGDSITARPRHEPLTLLSAVAARIRKPELGTAVLLPALRNPVVLAHGIATLDQISEGRFILGVGIASDVPNIRAEFTACGVPFEKRVGRMLEGLRLCRELWGGQPVDWNGRWVMEQAVLGPTPHRPGGPPIWIGAVAEPAVRRAGRIGDGYMGGDTGPAEFAEQVGWVREGQAEGAVQRPFQLSIYQPTFAWEGEDAWSLVRDHHHYLNWKYEDMDEARGRAGDAPAPPPLTPESEAEIRRHALVGTPEQVAEGIRAYGKAAGGELHFVAQLYWPGMPYERQRDAMRVFAERETPLLRD